MYEWLVFLLPVAATLSWWQGRRHALKQFEAKYNRNFTKGINYYLNNDSDSTFEYVKKLAKEQGDNFEANVALGNMFRKRGELDKAISIHQNALSNLTIDENQRNYILYELAKDYQAAGLLDRAEQVLQSLVYSTRNQPKYLLSLLSIYEALKDWDKAIQILKDTSKRHGSHQHVRLAHYLCEKAVELNESQEYVKSIELINEARLVDAGNIRCYWELAQIFFKTGDYRKSIHALESIHRQTSLYYMLTLPMLRKNFIQLNAEDEYIHLLEGYFKVNKDVSTALALVECYLPNHQIEQAKAILLELLSKKPSVRALKALISIETQACQDKDDAVVRCTEQTLQAVIDKKAYYRCQSCGYETHALLWHCPKCATWGSLLPRKSRMTDVE